MKKQGKKETRNSEERDKKHFRKKQETFKKETRNSQVRDKRDKKERDK